MRKEVTIQQSKDGIITAGCDKGACEGCKGSFFCTSKNTVFEVLNPENIELKAGDKAEIDMPPSKTLFSIFMSLGLPLILFIPGYFIASLFSSRACMKWRRIWTRQFTRVTPQPGLYAAS